jgi:hypothetical protein
MWGGTFCNSKLKPIFILFAKNPIPPGVNTFVHTISKSCTVSHVRCKLRVEITVAPQADLLWYNWHLCHLQFLCDLPILIIAPACDLLIAEWKIHTHTHTHTHTNTRAPMGVLSHTIFLSISFRNITIWAVKDGMIIRWKDEQRIICHCYCCCCPCHCHYHNLYHHHPTFLSQG